MLELGCGDGGNLLPMAYGLTGSRLVGIDLAPTAIAKAREVARALGLDNVEFACADLATVGRELGEFDYVIAHGVYSWVPEAVSDRLLAVCRASLAPSGVAFVSYNALPGAHLRTMLREMMLFDARGVDAPDARARRARQFLEALADGNASGPGYRQLVAEALEQAHAKGDAALLHDELAPSSRPSYFHEFVDHARTHGLQYLAEADYFEMHTSVPSPAVALLLAEQDGDIVAKEQYLDFLKFRTFRQTLLCRADVTLDRGLPPEVAQRFCVASAAVRTEVAGEHERSGRAVVEFRGPRGGALRTDEPVIEATLDLVAARWPERVPFADVLPSARASARRGTDGTAAQTRTEAEDARVLGEAVLRAYAANVVELHVDAGSFVRTAGQQPRVSALARRQAQEGGAVSTLRHTTLRIDDPEGRRLLTLLDGTRDRATLVRLLAGEGEPPPGLVEKLDRKLDELGRLALLEA